MAHAIRRHWLGLTVVVLLLASIACALAQDAPHPLPAVALGSTALLYAEKAAAFFVVFLTFVVVLVRAFAGDLPSEIRGLKYALRETSATAAASLDDLNAMHRDLVERVDKIAAVDPARSGR